MMDKEMVLELMASIFTWTGKLGVCERSDLSPKVNASIVRDGTFFVRSDRTNKVELFRFVRRLWHREDIIGWEFESASLAGLKIHILND